MDLIIHLMGFVDPTRTQLKKNKVWMANSYQFTKIGRVGTQLKF